MNTNDANASAIFLLKTRSTPTDGYEDYFRHITDPSLLSPNFVRVFEHSFVTESLQSLDTSIQNGNFISTDSSAPARFGGIIFTSQRAVDAFARVLSSIEDSALHRLLPSTLPLYVVGPATAKAVRALGLPCQVVGEDTGNGDALADFILATHPKSVDGRKRLPLLFLVGEQRRDIIPRKLQSPQLTELERIEVLEMTVYETREKVDFAAEFGALLEIQQGHAKDTWVVVFSPTGCRAMLDTLGWLDQSAKYSAELAQRHQTRVKVATIGPTTRDHLINEFSFEPHVCAERPTPDGIGEGIKRFYIKLAKK